MLVVKMFHSLPLFSCQGSNICKKTKGNADHEKVPIIHEVYAFLLFYILLAAVGKLQTLSARQAPVRSLLTDKSNVMS